MLPTIEFPGDVPPRLRAQAKLQLAAALARQRSLSRRRRVDRKYNPISIMLDAAAHLEEEILAVDKHNSDSMDKLGRHIFGYLWK